MRPGQIVFSAAHIFVVFFILALGAFFISLPNAPDFRSAFFDLLSSHPSFFVGLGTSLLVLGGALLIGFYLMNRKRYFQLSLNCSKTLVDEDIIRDYVEKYWKTSFSTSVDNVIVHGKKRLEVIASLPKDADDTSLERVQDELGLLLARKLGYDSDFVLTIREST